MAETRAEAAAPDVVAVEETVQAPEISIEVPEAPSEAAEVLGAEPQEPQEATTVAAEAEAPDTDETGADDA